MSSAAAVRLFRFNFCKKGIFFPYCVSNQSKFFKNIRSFSSNIPPQDDDTIDDNTYEKVCSETLESLCDYFEDVVESSKHLVSSDVEYSDGVLTVKLGNPYGTYVINRQTPNKQIWLSSPTSGPKRYDFFQKSKNAEEAGEWIYKHTGESLHSLLQKEIKLIMKADVDFFKLPYSGKANN